MTDQPTSGLAWVPEACTLPTAEQPLRLAEFDALFTEAVRDSTRLSTTHLRLQLMGGADLEPVVRDLTARETQCCSFFTFGIVAPAAGHVVLDVEVPPAHVNVLDALAERADAKRTQP
ncbi:hypothetical protein [Catellatospora citrea]|uniref:Arsenate reductase n=1 Tax=Catellatospora citrea TaxID=53366 RepID=A0A8J3KL72_9ACTN|nr:hypothetical protein [Catellatospora citrea]RKE09086.1 hypothetical protein C8E86_3962 [Catellatospora citrea]GIG03020.1 hypothetical protein Cci01nite_81130 [Catellatospora citrea]